MDRLKIVFCFLLVILQFTCNTQKEKNNITIKIIMPKIQAEKLKGRYLYLYDVSKRIPLDSVIIRGENTVLNLKADSSFEAREACIKYYDTNENHVAFLRPLGFNNNYLKRTINSIFYLDKGITTIKTYSRNGIDSTFLSYCKGSKQNEPLFRDIELYYPKDSIDSEKVIKKDIEIIDQYPFSFHLLKQLFYYKEYFSTNDLKILITHFDNEVKQATIYKSFSDYFSVSRSFDREYPFEINLQDSTGLFEPIGEDKAQFNLIVFWASWCAPCRKEIPELKAMYDLYKEDGLSISSISIDSDKKSWLLALQQEKMPWKQLIANGSTLKLLDLNYNIKFIPKAYLFDKNNKLIQKFGGANSGLKSKLSALFGKNN